MSALLPGDSIFYWSTSSQNDLSIERFPFMFYFDLVWLATIKKSSLYSATQVITYRKENTKPIKTCSRPFATNSHLNKIITHKVIKLICITVGKHIKPKNMVFSQISLHQNYNKRETKPSYKKESFACYISKPEGLSYTFF